MNQQENSTTIANLKNNWTLLLFSVPVLLLSLRLEGWGSADTTIAPQFIMLPFTLCLIGAIVFLCGNQRTLPRFALLGRIPFLTVAAVIAALEQTLAILLLIVESIYFRRLGYRLSIPALSAVALLSVSAFTLAFLGRKAVLPARLLLASGFSFSLTVIYSIAFFPLNPMKSDCLPLISAANLNFLSGHFPYITYPLVSGPVVLTYLPATWLVYLPAVILHVDLRWTNLLLSLAAIAVTYFSVRPSHRPLAASLLSLFILLPFSQFQHDIYTSLQWFLLAATFALLERQRWLAAAAAMACGVAASQLILIMSPFFAVFLFRRLGLRKTLQAAFVFLIFVALWVGPFLIASPQQFLYGVLTHWSLARGITVRVFNFSFWLWVALAHFGADTVRNLQRIQTFALLILFAVSLRSKLVSPVNFWRWAAASVTLFTLTNFIVWPYFYVTGLFALVLSILASPASSATNELPALISPTASADLPAH